MKLQQIPKKSGTYIVILYLDKTEKILIGKLGEIKFSKGYYAYIGSAFGLGGLKSRISRHSKINKKLHWHIDYLREKCEFINFFFKESLYKDECNIAEKFQNERINFKEIKCFGCSDCKCTSHLFHFSNKKIITKIKNFIVK